MSSIAGSQEVEVTVEGRIKRLVPCTQHEAVKDGLYLFREASGFYRQAEAEGAELRDGEQVIRNPNGFRHDCAACAAVEHYDELEKVVTRHVL